MNALCFIVIFGVFWCPATFAADPFGGFVPIYPPITDPFFSPEHFTLPNKFSYDPRSRARLIYGRNGVVAGANFMNPLDGAGRPYFGVANPASPSFGIQIHGGENGGVEWHGRILFPTTNPSTGGIFKSLLPYIPEECFINLESCKSGLSRNPYGGPEGPCHRSGAQVAVDVFNRPVLAPLGDSYGNLGNLVVPNDNLLNDRNWVRKALQNGIIEPSGLAPGEPMYLYKPLANQYVLVEPNGFHRLLNAQEANFLKGLGPWVNLESSVNGGVASTTGGISGPTFSGEGGLTAGSQSTVSFYSDSIPAVPGVSRWQRMKSAMRGFGGAVRGVGSRLVNVGGMVMPFLDVTLAHKIGIDPIQYMTLKGFGYSVEEIEEIVRRRRRGQCDIDWGT